MESSTQQISKFDEWRGFHQSSLPKEWFDKLAEESLKCRGSILKMTTLAASGHPGGSMSSIDAYLMLYHMANVDPKNPNRDDRDRIIISHGHTSPGAYTALASAGFFNVDEAIAGFRLAGSPFEGHVERSVPGIEWGTGNLGQGLSVGLGKAIYARLSGQNFHTYVLMGDGEQQKGQISESRRIAVKYKLTDITAIIDYNQLQISGEIDQVMPQNIVDEWRADGWNVIEVNGHDINQLYDALKNARINQALPTMILARTIMGHGVSFMENKAGYHGAPVPKEQLTEALAELKLENDLDKYKEMRASGFKASVVTKKNSYPTLKAGDPKIYAADVSTDCRSAFGNALVSFADANSGNADFKIGVFDCDLAGSVKTQGFADKYPDSFFQMGISEHSTATAMGSLSAENAVSVWADFGVFGIVETYNQARLNDINHANAKVFCTHCGINVGEDGMTHQCIDYFGLLNSCFNWKVITPADPNQCDRIVRHVLSTPGNFAVIMGRAKLPTITNEKGEPYFGNGYEYRYGRFEKIRSGSKTALVSAGNMLFEAMKAWDELNKNGQQISLYSVSDWSDLHDDDIKDIASYENVVVLEDHNLKTGLGTAISDKMMSLKLTTNIIKKGVPHFGSSGKPADLYKLLGLDSGSVVKTIEEL